MARGRITKAGETSAFSISFLGHRLLTLRIGAVFGLILLWRCGPVVLARLNRG